jgi:hypothetical protein
VRLGYLLDAGRILWDDGAVRVLNELYCAIGAGSELVFVVCTRLQESCRWQHAMAVALN